MAKAPAEESKTAPAKADKGKTAKAQQPAKPNVFARLGQYFRDVRSEMRRVVWPARPEVVNSSMVVVVTLVFFIFFAVVVDNVVQFLLFGVLGKISIGG